MKLRQKQSLTYGKSSWQHTVSGAVREEYEAEIGMDDDVAVTFLHLAHTAAIGERELAVAREATEDGDDVLRSLVRLVYYDDSAHLYRPQKRGVGVLDDAVLQDGLEHQLVYGGVSM